MSESRVVIRRLDPRRRRNMLLAAGLGVLSVFIAGLILGWYLRGEQQTTQARYREALAELQQSYVENNQQRQRIAALQASEQVARNANSELRAAIVELQNQLAEARNDLSSFESLAGNGNSRSGLAIHKLLLRPGGIPRLFDYTLTLAQNLEQAELIRGRVELWVEGTRDGEIVRIGLDQMRPQASDGLKYAFKYFQVLEGALLLPENFVPDGVTVHLVPENEEIETVEADFDWPAVVKRESSSNSNTLTGEQSNHEQH